MNLISYEFNIIETKMEIFMQARKGKSLALSGYHWIFASWVNFQLGRKESHSLKNVQIVVSIFQKYSLEKEM